MRVVSPWSWLIDPCLNTQESQSTVTSPCYKFRPQNKAEIWLWLPNTRGGEGVSIVWSYLELQDPPQALGAQLRERYIRQGVKGGMMKGGSQGGVVGVSAKVQVHYFFCLTWPTDENIIIIIKKPAERSVLAIITISSTPHNKAVIKSCWKYAVLGSDMCCFASCA